MSSPKQDALSSKLRHRIASGFWRPGERIPNREDLVGHFGVSLTTVNATLLELKEEGFVVARGRSGTFVTDNPPHLTRFGVAFPFSPGFPGNLWSWFHQAVHLEAQGARLQNERRFVFFFNLADSDRANPAQIELHDDVQNHRLAGLIMVGQAYGLEGSTRAMDPVLPKVCIGESGDPSIPSIVPDYDAWLRRAVETLAQRDRRRIALVCHQSHATPVVETSYIDRFMRIATDAGVTSEPVFCHPGNLAAPQAVSQAVRLMLSLPPERRPDGLIIGDDNLINHAVHGLVQSGISVGDGGDLDVVAHANFPYTVSAPVPLIYQGYDVRWMLARAVELLHEQRVMPALQQSARRTVLMPVLQGQEFTLHENPLDNRYPGVSLAQTGPLELSSDSESV